MRKGQKMSEEQKQKISAANKGKRRTEEQNRKNSKTTKILWQDPKYRKNTIKAQTKAKQQPEARQRHSKTQARNWRDPQYRQMITKKITKAMNRPSEKQRQADAQKRHWEDLEYRKIIINSMNRPEVKQKQSERTKLLWHDTEYKEKNRRAIKEAHNRPEVKRRHSEASKRNWEDSEYREKMFASSSFFDRTIIRPTSIELLVLAQLLHSGIYDFIPEYHINNGNGKSYFVDFMIISNFIIIEADGDYYHGLEGCKEADLIRQEDIEAQGWTVIRFTETEIHTNLQRVGSNIMTEIIA